MFKTKLFLITAFFLNFFGKIIPLQDSLIKNEEYYQPEQVHIAYGGI